MMMLKATLGIFLFQDMSEAEKRRNKEHKEINSEVKMKLKGDK